MPIEQVVAMFDETSQRLQFGAELLQIAIENIDQGISVVDKEQRLVAWNRRYVEMFGYPSELVEVGRPKRLEIGNQANFSRALYQLKCARGPRLPALRRFFELSEVL